MRTPFEGGTPTPSVTRSADGLPRWWPLLFPLTFLAHIGEEFYGGFPAWAALHLGFRLDTSRFLAIAAAGWCGMLVGSIAATAQTEARWLMVVVATMTFANGCAHIITSAATSTYSPGAISGTLFWIPLGVFTLHRTLATTPRPLFWTAVSIGLFVHAVVISIALAG
jgi:hypothetical protein